MYERMSAQRLGMCAHLLFLEVAPLLVRFDHKPLKGVWVSHLESEIGVGQWEMEMAGVV